MMKSCGWRGLRGDRVWFDECFSEQGGWIPLSLSLGIAANLERPDMSLMLRRWQNEVTTSGAALRLRRAGLAL